MAKKIKHKVYVTKSSLGGYIVTEYTFDKNGDTVNHKIHGSCVSFSEAQLLKKNVLECYA